MVLALKGDVLGHSTGIVLPRRNECKHSYTIILINNYFFDETIFDPKT